jgi:hypothetical protein
MSGAKVKLGTPNLKANLTDTKTITLTWEAIPDAEAYEIDDVGDLTKKYDSANPTTATFTKIDDFVDETKYKFNVTAKPATGSTDKEDSEKGTLDFVVNLSILASSAKPLATVSAAGGKKGVQMNLDLTADMKEDGTFDTVKINKSTVNGEELKEDPTKEDMKEILDKIPPKAAGGARKSRKAKRTKKGGKKRRNTLRRHRKSR